MSKKSEKSKQVYSSNLSFYLFIRGKTQNDLHNELGYSEGQVSQWLTGGKIPSPIQKRKIAKWLNIAPYNFTKDVDRSYQAVRKRVFLKAPILFDMISKYGPEEIEIAEEKITHYFNMYNEFGHEYYHNL